MQGGYNSRLAIRDFAYAHDGAMTVRLRDGTISSRFLQVDTYDLHNPGYTEAKIDFWFISEGLEDGERFDVLLWNGFQWNILSSFKAGADFENGVYYNPQLLLSETDFLFTDKMKIGFKTFGNEKNDRVYFDTIQFLAR